MVKTSKMECTNKIIPQVLDRNRSLYLILNQNGYQIASEFGLIINK